jgi:hypothetical protein
MKLARNNAQSATVDDGTLASVPSRLFALLQRSMTQAVSKGQEASEPMSD